MSKSILVICLMSLIASVFSTDTVCTLDVAVRINDNQAQLTENMMIKEGYLKDVARFLYCVNIVFTDRGCLTGGTDAAAYKNYKVNLPSGNYVLVTSGWFEKKNRVS